MNAILFFYTFACIFLFNTAAIAQSLSCESFFKATAIFLTENVLSPEKNIPQRQQLLKPANLEIVNNKVKVAFFDADDTLRTSSKGNPSANSKEEILILAGIPQRLKLLADQGYLIAIVSNQAGIPKRLSLEMAIDFFKHTIALIRGAGGEVHYFDFAEKYDHFRKPQPGMFHRLEKHLQEQLGSSLTIDKKNSFMVGDAAYKNTDIKPDGTPGTDFSNTDRLFAEGLGLPFFEAKEFFKSE